MKKNILYPIFILLASLTLGACGSDDDNNNNDKSETAYTVETVTEAPTWQVDFSGTDERPDWQEPNPALYENWAIVIVQLEDALKPYVTDDDLLAFFVGGEMRGLTSPAVSQAEGAEADADRGTFLLKAYGNEADQNVVTVTLRYYCARLKQTFTRTVQMRYDMGEVYGLDDAIVPQFTLGCGKFPVAETHTLDPTDLAPIDVIPGEGDLLAAFVGEECRGVAEFNAPILLFNFLTVYGRTENERYTLKYYHAASQRVYTFTKTI